jgi:hypothetical protein
MPKTYGRTRAAEDEEDGRPDCLQEVRITQDLYIVGKADPFKPWIDQRTICETGDDGVDERIQDNGNEYGNARQDQ